MEADIGELGCSESKRKRKRPTNHAKLLVGAKVEVRSLDEGFRGSWHPATVMSCENQARRVQYDHLLCDDGSAPLIERIKVPLIVDGIIPTGRPPHCHRGLVRPLTPRSGLNKGALCYGHCVDVKYQDAWWEGVIFDHHDGSEDRTVFFPDGGDTMQFKIDMLRITRDWDEFTEEWKPRGKWLFLELVEEFERDWPLQVSVRQIWYEVREKRQFREIREWTSTVESIWKSLVWEVIFEYCSLTANHFFQELVSSGELVQEALPPLSENHLDLILGTEADSGNSLAITAVGSDASDTRLFPTNLDIPTAAPPEEIEFITTEESGRLDMNLLASSNMLFHEETPCLPPPPPSSVPFSPDELSRSYSNLNNGVCSPSSRTSERKSSGARQKKHYLWVPAGHDIVPGPEFCPDSVNEYLAPRWKQKRNDVLKLSVRKHLAFLGWKIDYVRDENGPRLRYTSPDGKSYLSLVKVCEALADPASEITSYKIRSLFSPPLTEENCDSGSLFSSPVTEQTHTSTEVSVMPSRDHVVIEPDYCPQAVVEYYGITSSEKRYNWDSRKNPKLKNVKLKAKKHLSAVGWSLWYYVTEDRRELRYRCPTSGRSYSSLRAACKSCLDEGGVHDGNAFTPRPSPNIRKKRRASRTLIKGQDDLDGDSPTHVLRSSKRARQLVSSSSCQNPRTVLSWLIDNNVVLPRAKVRYVSRKGTTMQEGRITRDGIKCNCCQNVFTLSKFEAHAGSTNHRPSANIFLEDGRSLLDCQSQYKCNNGKRNIMTEPQDLKCSQPHKTNDYICSVCHFGGELVLCDQCPSSFHTYCLGLKDIPDGDWFCPSCCCGICGRGRFNNDTEQFTDDSILSCVQCEHQYHVRCLRKTSAANVDNCPKGSWLCNERCKQVYLGLQELLRKPVPVGGDNLTWTLLKYNDEEHGGSDMEDLTENYSKLNVALSVMHECFEAVKEPRTGRDLVEDVIFCRRSELNRLNFRGFYTVLLERNDELITAATVRVHGEKVAEVPLIGTRFKYRRLGMCRILMSELEKKLMELGVERLVLPAVPSVLNTWTTAFGFSKMSELERLKFLDYTFLDFQGTVMCQKLLKNIYSSDSSLLTRTQQTIHDVVSEGNSLVLDGFSAISEPFQAEQIDGEIPDQGPKDMAGVDDDCSGSAPPGFPVIQPILPYLPCQNGICLDFSVEEGTYLKDCQNNSNQLLFKCYKRRRISSC